MKLLTKRNFEIIKIASNDPTRLAMGGLFIDGQTSVASDGHRLIMVQSHPLPDPVDNWIPNSVKWDSKEEPFIIDKKAVEKVLKNIPKNQEMPILNRVAIGTIQTAPETPKKAVCQTTDLAVTDNVESKTVEGKYPDYKRVIPQYEDENLYQRVGISAKYLKEVCIILEKYQDNSMVTLYVKKDQDMDKEKPRLGEHSPVVLTAEDDDETLATAVIMPIRLDPR